MGDRTRLTLALMLSLVALSAANGATGTSKVVHASDVRAKIEALQPAEFDNCIIVGDLNLSKLKIDEPVHFNFTLFQNSVNFNSTTFNRTAYFAVSKFSGPAYFKDSEFNGPAGFGYSTFNSTAYFEDSSFNKGVNFLDSDFNRGADFTGSRFNVSAYFESSMFKSNVSFTATKFNGQAIFLYSKFNSYAVFAGSEFNSDAYFDQAVFRGDVEFVHSKFNKDVRFWFTSFNGTAIFEDSKFNDTTLFEGSKFNGTADFKDSEFNNAADFSHSWFNSTTDFGETIFQKETKFSGSKFRGNTNFNNGQFKEDALFEGAIFNSTLYLTATKYVTLYIRWRDINNVANDDTAFLSLMENFKRLGYLEDYDNCYFEYRKEHRSQSWSGGFHGMSPIEEWIRKGVDFVLEWSYGYGKRPLRPLGGSSIVIVFFGLFWHWVGLGTKEWPPVARLNSGSLWLHALVFSLTVFLSGTKLFINPPDIPLLQGRSISLVRRAFIAERALGAFFFILFFLAIGSTIVR